MSIQWEAAAQVDGMVRRRFLLQHEDGDPVPGVFWAPLELAAPAPLILHGHGGSQHKEAAEIVEVARRLAERFGFASAAIDGPIHGARRTDASEDRGRIRGEFLTLWAGDNRIGPMVRDWQAVLDRLVELPAVDASAVGWCGLSMGTAYGLPLCAAEPRIRAALLGMWSAGYANSADLLTAAPKVRCPVMFQQKWDDELFDRDGQIRLFDALGSVDKRLCVYPGRHVHASGDQMADILAFLASRLRSGG